MSYIPKQDRIYFTRLRLSAHKLHIETGRYTHKKDRLDPENRICKYCSENLCEDEFHFMMNCSLYDEYRKGLFSSIISKFPIFKEYDQQNQFIWLMSNLDKFCLIQIAKFVKNAFIKRNSTGITEGNV